MSTGINTNLVYPFVPFGTDTPPNVVDRLLDIVVIVFGDSKGLATPSALHLQVDTDELLLFKGDTELLTIDLPTTVEQSTDTVEGVGVRAHLVWGPGEVTFSDTAKLQIEPCKIVWLSPYNNAAFKAAIDADTGLGFKAGDGLDVTASPDRVLSGNPTIEEAVATPGLRMLNGLSSRAISVSGTESVQIDITSDDEATTITVSEK